VVDQLHHFGATPSLSALLSFAAYLSLYFHSPPCHEMAPYLEYREHCKQTARQNSATKAFLVYFELKKGVWLQQFWFFCGEQNGHQHSSVQSTLCEGPTSHIRVDAIVELPSLQSTFAQWTHLHMSKKYQLHVGYVIQRTNCHVYCVRQNMQYKLVTLKLQSYGIFWY